MPLPLFWERVRSVICLRDDGQVDARMQLAAGCFGLTSGLDVLV
jgi:hypothetical protein